jgi:hypothetical protein
MVRIGLMGTAAWHSLAAGGQGELVSRHLGLGFQLHPGDVIFRSAELVHENLAVKGDRRSIVMTTDCSSFTGKGQPLDPSKLALIEATLLSINARYN